MVSKHHFIFDGAKNYFHIQAVNNFPLDQVPQLSFKILQKNAFFANPENVLLAMLADDKKEIRNKQ